MSEFIQSLPGCEEHGKVFKDEVSVQLNCSMFLNGGHSTEMQWIVKYSQLAEEGRNGLCCNWQSDTELSNKQC